VALGQVSSEHLGVPCQLSFHQQVHIHYPPYHPHYVVSILTALLNNQLKERENCTVFWNAIPYSVEEVSCRLGRTYCLHLQGRRVNQAIRRVALLAINYHRNNFYRIYTSCDAERRLNLIVELLCWHCNNWNLTFYLSTVCFYLRSVVTAAHVLLLPALLVNYMNHEFCT
jgi:hypothetical protein